MWLHCLVVPLPLHKSWWLRQLHVLQAVGGTQSGLSSPCMSEADIVHGEAFTERKSTFQVCCPL